MPQKVTIKLRVNGSWESLYPKTTPEQIDGSTTLGRLFLLASNPNAERFVQINSDNEIVYLTDEQLKANIDAADAIHAHKISDISEEETEANPYQGLTLVGALNLKADLDPETGNITPSQLPEFLFGGLRFEDAIDASITIGTAAGNFGENFTEEDKGKYFVASTTLNITVGTNAMVKPPGNEGQFEGTFPIEAGDWLIFLGIETSTLMFAINNNRYPFATPTKLGVVKLSGEVTTSRSSLHTSRSGEKVVDEKRLRDIIKDVHFGATTPPGALDGDIWFQTEE